MASMNPLHYCLVVRCAPEQQSQAYSALGFARALLAKGHKLECIFFYQQGVLTASSLRTPAQDELNITQQWQQLQADYQLDLNVCIAAALQRGIVDKNECQRYNLNAYNLASGFHLAGLGQLASATATCDRVVTFGAVR